MHLLGEGTTGGDDLEVEIRQECKKHESSLKRHLYHYLLGHRDQEKQHDWNASCQSVTDTYLERLKTPILCASCLVVHELMDTVANSSQ